MGFTCRQAASSVQEIEKWLSANVHMLAEVLADLYEDASDEWLDDDEDLEDDEDYEPPSQESEEDLPPTQRL